MKKTCSTCKFWRIKTDATGICDNPDWRVYTLTSEETGIRFLADLKEKYNERQIVNLVREFLQLRTWDAFGCNQWEKREKQR